MDSTYIPLVSIPILEILEWNLPPNGLPSRSPQITVLPAVLWSIRALYIKGNRLPAIFQIGHVKHKSIIAAPIRNLRLENRTRPIVTDSFFPCGTDSRLITNRNNPTTGNGCRHKNKPHHDMANKLPMKHLSILHSIDTPLSRRRSNLSPTESHGIMAWVLPSRENLALFA